ncbi:hypothetical protein Vretimale_5758 [Volvox reticuliferus]|uniref:Uncharacterized protein n=1 Tax=Volvox reticuliferus TaxID=1737510 RepID=A0A8J4LKX6_9CHLO|nr:hypothetical protein Vretimale_5758 [Volvox reticuliferus]
MSKAPAKPKLDKFMGMPLGDAGEVDSDSDSSTNSSSDEEDLKLPKKKPNLSLEDLERAGYKSGPSVLHIKAPSEPEPQNWNCLGRQHGRLSPRPWKKAPYIPSRPWNMRQNSEKKPARSAWRPNKDVQPRTSWCLLTRRKNENVTPVRHQEGKTTLRSPSDKPERSASTLGSIDSARMLVLLIKLLSRGPGMAMRSQIVLHDRLGIKTVSNLYAASA